MAVEITYDVLAQLKVMLDSNFNQKVLLSYTEDVANHQTVIKVVLQDGFPLIVRLDWFEKRTMTCGQRLWALFFNFKQMYEDIYKCDS